MPRIVSYCGSIQIRYAVLATAASPTTAAAIARAMSNPLTVGPAATGAGRGAAEACRGAAGAAAGAAALGRGGVGACVGAAVLKAAAGAGVAAGPPGGSVGNLLVGAADGFGGRLIRTVSFLG